MLPEKIFKGMLPKAAYHPPTGTKPQRFTPQNRATHTSRCLMAVPGTPGQPLHLISSNLGNLAEKQTYLNFHTPARESTEDSFTILGRHFRETMANEGEALTRFMRSGLNICSILCLLNHKSAHPVDRGCQES